MKLLVMVVAVTMALALGGVAQAQTTTTEDSKGYVEGVAQSAFGNVTSQSFGAEAGVSLGHGLYVFVDAGYVRDTAPSVLGVNAQIIAGFLSQSATSVTFQVYQPVAFGIAGLKYVVPVTGRIEPYVLGGVGAARIRKDVTFTVAGADVTSTLAQYGVVLGSDLAGTETKVMFSVGGGVMWPAWRRVVADFQYRFGRVSTSGPALNISRAGIGIGVRF